MPCRVAGIGDHGQMRDLLEQSNPGHIERVPHRRLEGADAALAEDDVGVSIVENQLRRA
jgi:hypothetical protein